MTKTMIVFIRIRIIFFAFPRRTPSYDVDIKDIIVSHQIRKRFVEVWPHQSYIGSREFQVWHCYLHHTGASSCYSEIVPKTKVRSVRQSVTIPAKLAADVRRVAKERHLTMSRALVDLAERGVQAEAEAKQKLRDAYRGFIEEAEPTRKNAAGRDLIRAIFGNDSIAEDSIR
jgi:hypothetical protein